MKPVRMKHELQQIVSYQWPIRLWRHFLSLSISFVLYWFAALHGPHGMRWFPPSCLKPETDTNVAAGEIETHAIASWTAWGVYPKYAWPFGHLFQFLLCCYNIFNYFHFQVRGTVVEVLAGLMWFTPSLPPLHRETILLLCWFIGW